MCYPRIRRISHILFLLSQGFFLPLAFAAGFQLNEVSPGLQGAATAGAAAADNDVSSMFLNPATLSTLVENQGYLGGSIIAPDVKMSHATATHTVNIPGSPPSSITAPVQGKSSQNGISRWALVPDGYVGRRINDSLVVGIALTAPFGLTTQYDRNSVVRFTAKKSSLMTININPALAIKLDEQLSFGFGVQFQYAEVSFSNFNGAYTGIPAIDDLIAADYPTKLRGRGWGFGYNTGILVKPIEGTRLGVGYRSRILQKVTGNGSQYVVPGRTLPAPSQDFLFNARTTVNGTLNIPAILVMSAAQDIRNWTLKASAQLNFWNTFKHISINMPDAFATNSTVAANWKNAWKFALGTDYRATPRWTVRMGVAFDETPTRSQYRDPRIPDSNRFWLTGGFSYQLKKSLALDGAYEHIFGQNQTVNVTQASGSSATSTVPLEVNQVNAKFKSSVDIVALAIRYNFS